MDELRQKRIQHLERCQALSREFELVYQDFSKKWIQYQEDFNKEENEFQSITEKEEQCQHDSVICNHCGEFTPKDQQHWMDSGFWSVEWKCEKKRWQPIPFKPPISKRSSS
jgi:hypothetical protein